MKTGILKYKEENEMTPKKENNGFGDMNYQELLKTTLQKGVPPELLEKRKRRIEEAIEWEGGSSIESQKKYLLTKLPNKMEVYFLKPGKEKFEKNSNPNDMLPCVGGSNKPYRFDEVWKQLSEISFLNHRMFIVMLVLVYRNSFMLDHIEEGGHIRYKPCKAIEDCIQKLEHKFGKQLEYGALGLLHFMDILGWNEDVKYNVQDGRVVWKKDRKRGRVNSLLSCITIPYKTNEFAREIIKHSGEPKDIDWSLVYEPMQRLMSSGGICPAKQKELAIWLSPYIVKADL